MRRGAILIGACLLLSSCVAESVMRHRPRKGPIKAVGYIDYGGGDVRYSIDGWSWFVRGRRRHAKRLMRKNCGKDLEPRIVDEYARQDADAAYVGEDLAANMQQGGEHYKIEPFVHFLYECRPKGFVEAPASTTTARPPLLVIPPISTSTSTEIPR